MREFHDMIKLGQISKNNFEKFQKAVDATLLKEIQDYDSKHNQTSSLITGEQVTYVEAEFDSEDFFSNKFFESGRNELITDREFILSNGNLEDFVNLKRKQAEEKLIKLRIGLKKLENIPLSPAEQNYLKNPSAFANKKFTQ